jgi:hypothetical protein
MTDAVRPTLADFLPDEIEGLGDQIKAQIGEQKGAIAWPMVEGEAIKGLKSELGNFDLFGLLGQAWSKARELRGYRDPAAQPAGTTGIVPLGQHQAVMAAEPALHLTIAGWAMPPLKLGLVGTAIFESVHLSVRDGHVVAAAPGKCAFTTALSLGSTPLHTPKELAKLKLPGEIRFEPGWKIP